MKFAILHVTALALLDCRGYQEKRAAVQRLEQEPSAPAPWILRGRTRDFSAYIDSSRIESKRLDEFTGVWIRIDTKRPLPPPAPPIKTTDFHAALDCKRERVRFTGIEVFDSTGQRHAADWSSEQMPVETFRDSTYKQYLGVLVSSCAWLANRTAPPLIEDVGVDSR